MIQYLPSSTSLRRDKNRNVMIFWQHLQRHSEKNDRIVHSKVVDLNYLINSFQYTCQYDLLSGDNINI